MATKTQNAAPALAAVRKQIGEGLRLAREAAGLSIEDFSARLEVKPQYVWALEKGTQTASINQLLKIAEVLDCTVKVSFEKL